MYLITRSAQTYILTYFKAKLFYKADELSDSDEVFFVSQKASKTPTMFVFYAGESSKKPKSTLH